MLLIGYRFAHGNGRKEGSMELRAATRYRLSGTKADGTVVERDLSDGEITIGRADTADLVIDDARVSRQHARIFVHGETVSLHDLESTNGTLLNGERIGAAELQPGDQISLGGFTLQLLEDSADGATTLATGAEGTMVVASPLAGPGATRILERIPPPPAEAPIAPAIAERGIVSEQMLQEPIISEQALIENGVEVTVTDCLAVGGGMGSFVWTDILRNAGVPASSIAVVGNEQVPYGRYQRLCNNSQIPSHERLRSNSDSRPDNIWGFPGYAPAEVLREIRRGNLGLAGRLLWQIFGEPALTQTYTPRSGEVFASLDREAARIGWSQMLRFGRARAIRKSREGRILVVASASDERTRRHYAVSARFLHLAVGYPAIQLLPDLASFREHHDPERRLVVAAYEEHEHVYQALRQRGGTIVLRGRGIVASRILQRIWEERKHNPNIRVVHLHRSHLVAGHRYGNSKREVEAEWEFQPFNWPKGCWTGEQRFAMEKADPAGRKQLLETWGGTTTADRRDWRRIVQEGLREGWYRPEYGVVREIRPSDDGKVTSRISNSPAEGRVIELTADFIVDCTGLVASPEWTPFMADLLNTYGLPRNPYGRLAVTDDFEIEGLRNGDARAYACGATTLGGPHAAVDSFLGLQYASFRAYDAMRHEAPGLIGGLNGLRSFGQWLKWARGAAP